jgi:hypothetical protein
MAAGAGFFFSDVQFSEELLATIPFGVSLGLRKSRTENKSRRYVHRPAYLLNSFNLLTDLLQSFNKIGDCLRLLSRQSAHRFAVRSFLPFRTFRYKCHDLVCGVARAFERWAHLAFACSTVARRTFRLVDCCPIVRGPAQTAGERHHYSHCQESLHKIS